MNYIRIQQALASQGFNPGPIDGVWGPRTRLAMQAWQRRNGLPVTDLPTDTVQVNLLGRSDGAPITWLDEATRLLGLREGPGKADNRTILDWAEDFDIHYPHDDIAWCGLFIAHCVRAALPNQPLPSNPLGARQWERLGIGCEPQLGAIGVFWRISKQSGKGHVGLLVGERVDAYLVRGGNQSDAVSDAWVAKSRLTATRWPATSPAPFCRKLPYGGAGGLSVNEA